MGKREPQIILKTDERKVVLELGLAGKFAAKSSGWDENRFFLEGDKLEVAVKNGRWGCSRTCPQARDRRWAAAQKIGCCSRTSNASSSSTGSDYEDRTVHATSSS